MSPRRRAGTAGHHLEWMQLLDIEGPFLALSVLLEVFPQGLDPDDPELIAQARALFDTWEDDRSDAGLEAFARSVLEIVLEYQDLLTVPEAGEFEATLPGRRTRLRPSIVVRESDQPPVLLVTLHPESADLGRTVVDEAGSASPIERLRVLLQGADLPLGLTTNGRQWALVHAPRGSTTSVAIWETELWFDERLTFRAFTSLLGVRRTIGAAEDETLPELFERSAHDERDVTTKLGYQVRRSIEVLVHAFDRADDEAGGELFDGIEPRTLYEGAVTVAMRLVFLLAAEARGLLPDDEAWIEAYAITSLRDQLEETSVAGGEELLERRFDAWARLLATFRAVHGGVEHDRLRLPGYGGGLFDPKRFPFIEGAGERPLRIPNRTILNILDSLQTLEVEVAGGRERRPLSYSALGVEQIGHTYERLLDHTAVRPDAPAVGLIGKKGEEPEIALAAVEEASREGRDQFVAWVAELTTKTPKTIDKALNANQDDARVARLHAACRGDDDLISRVLPFLGIVRDDDFEMPMVFRAGGLFVTQSEIRRSSGAHYTPPSLTEPIVRYALEPVVYRGPAEGVAEADWELKSPSELLELKVGDIAMGSGAFLVAACRYLADRLVEAWQQVPSERPDDLPRDPEEQNRIAKRLVAERCLYGVDKDPLAVEIAKVSLWLETMRRDRPFTFVDHSLRCGDSLLGLTSLDQLEALSTKPAEGESILVNQARTAVRATLDQVRLVREEIEASDALDLREAEQKKTALAESERKLHALKVVGDLIVGAALEEAAGAGKAFATMEAAADEISHALTVEGDRRDALLSLVEARAGDALMAGRARGALDPPQPFHWVLEFPEVFEQENAGFDATVGNPPFLGGSKITGNFGEPYRNLLVETVAGGRRGNADLVAYFFRRIAGLTRLTGGTLGLVATNTIAQGDSREVGLAELVRDGWMIFRADKSAAWPGEAGVTVAHVWARNGVPETPSLFDASLDPVGRVAGDPSPLLANQGAVFNGSKIYGNGFLLPPEAAETLIRSDPRLADVLQPYVVAEDIATRPDQSAPRIAINFRDWSATEASSYSACWKIVEEKVRPERARNKRKARRERWWQYGEVAPGLYRAIASNNRVLAGPQTSKYLFVTWLPHGWVYSHAILVFTFEDDGHAAVLSSTLHEAWARKYSGSMREYTRYSPTDCFQNFPFPDDVAVLDANGDYYLTYRKKTLLSEGQGLTKVYNRVHEQPEDKSERIRELRRLRRELDRAVVDAYGWTDLELDHDFRETPLGLRYTISEAVKTEVLDRLLELNHARHADEVARGLHHGKKGWRKKTPNTKVKGGPQLFDDE